MLQSRYNSKVYTDIIAQRRKRLIIDYDFTTRSMRDAHENRPSGVMRAAPRCLAVLRRQFLSHYFVSPPPWRVLMRQLFKDRALPDFCIIGPGKCGSSDLAVTVMSHPNVLCPLVKEPQSTYPLAWKPYYPTLKAVKRHARRHGVALCPLVSPYLHFLDVPVALSALRPDAKIVINLRNPTDLVFSMWKWILLNKEIQLVNRLPSLATFPAYVDKVIALFPELPDPFGPALHYGIYVTSVAHWFQAFGDNNVRIFDIAEYFNDRNAYFAHLERFLGLPHVPLPERLPVANRNPLEKLAATADASAKLREFFEPYNRRLWDLIGKEFNW